jgi:hypothetical protein
VKQPSIALSARSSLAPLLGFSFVSISPIAEPPDGIFGILPGTFNFTLLVTLGLTLALRARLRAAPRVAMPANSPWSWLPRHLILRALLLAILATLAFVPLTMIAIRALVASGALPLQWSLGAMIAFFVGYFVLVTWAVTPAVVWRALRDVDASN